MKEKAILCPDCNGHGHINGGDDHSSWSRTCDRCHGTGYTMVPMTSGDKIRSVFATDEGIAETIMSLDLSTLENGRELAFRYCDGKNNCIDGDGNITCTDEMRRACILRWLRKPADDTLPHSRIFEDKQESGLIEED